MRKPLLNQTDFSTYADSGFSCRVDTNLELLGKRECQWKNCSDQIGLSTCLWGTVLIVHGGFSPLRVAPLPRQGHCGLCQMETVS